MLVIDLSSNNAAPDFPALKARGVQGVWLKATEGHTYAFDRYGAWRNAAQKAGLHVGAYHFARPDAGSLAGDEADWFCRHAGKVGRTDLRPVLDYEHARLGGNDETWIRSWNHFVTDALGVGPLFYSYPWQIEQLKLKGTVGYGLWLADYGPDDGHPHPYTVPRPWKKLVAQQYTSKGELGTYGPVDLTRTFSGAVLAHPLLGRV